MTHSCETPLATSLLTGILSIALAGFQTSAEELNPQPFGNEFPRLDSDATGEWWKPSTVESGPRKGQPLESRLLVTRDQVVAFAL